jgi:biofilm PGA synthesis N-glycosyltransferase PgaC
MSSDTFVLVSAAYNEEKNIKKTIESVIRQTALPSEWIIVSDGSSDGTDDIIKQYSSAIDFIRFFRVDRAAGHNFGSKVRAINLGISKITVHDYAYIGILDTDISFGPDYFSRMLNGFTHNPNLGIAGGNIIQDINGKLERRSKSLNSVAGAVQLFRRDCFADTDGFIPMEYGGEDAAIEITARMKGWKVKTFPDIEVTHYGFVGRGYGSRINARYRFGERCFSLGYHFIFELARALLHVFQKPFLVGSIAEIMGFMKAKEQIGSPRLGTEVVQYLRKEQLGRLRAFFFR